MGGRSSNTDKRPWWYLPGSRKFLFRMATASTAIAVLNGTLLIVGVLTGHATEAVLATVGQALSLLVFIWMAISYWTSYRWLRRTEARSD